MNEIKAPEIYHTEDYLIFLAGAIDQGKADDWQKEVAAALKDYKVTLLNPRRDDWDDSWDQSIDDPQFREQVEWELNSMDKADLILVVFTKKSKAPITLMELGLHAKDDKCLVVCPTGYWRKGNVDIVCHRAAVPVYEEMEAAITDVKRLLEEEGLGPEGSTGAQ